MPQTLLDEEIILGLDSAGLLMTPEEFDSIEEYDENFRYELVNGVVTVSPIPLPEESNPNDLLGQSLRNYRDSHPNGKVLDSTMPQQYVRTANGRRIADRAIWAGLGRTPHLETDVPSIAVEFVSGRKRDRQRDYVDKRAEYREAGIGEYWIIDRFKRSMTVILNRPDGVQEIVVQDGGSYESPLLPGFQVPLAQMLGAADEFSR